MFELESMLEQKKRKKPIDEKARREREREGRRHLPRIGMTSKM